ncbi:MAG: hypothetical protein L7T84_09570 [Akkermansiaceae bacterium]|nr:hypothetical protein [Akkermansiaceae bacterium]
MSHRETPDEQEKLNPLKKRRWRLVVFLVALALASLFFQFVIEAPINIPDSFLALPVLSLWQPLFGIPLFALSIWWILNRRLPLLVLLVPLALIGYCGRILIGSPPERSSEDLEAMREVMSEQEFELYSEDHDQPRYKRDIFPPFK